MFFHLLELEVADVSPVPDPQKLKPSPFHGTEGLYTSDSASSSSKQSLRADSQDAFFHPRWEKA